MSAAKRNSEEEQITLLNWFRKARSKNIPVTGPMLQGKILHAIQKIWTANSCKLKSFSLPKNTTSRLQPLTNIETGALKTALSSCAYMPTLPDYPGVSQTQSQSPALLWPKLPDKRKFGSVAHQKLRFKLHVFQNSKIIWLHMLVLQFLASFSCVMHVVGCQGKVESFFSVTPI